jgi:hypothetical protein
MPTQADIDAVAAAIARGESEVRFADGRTVKYRSVAELREAYGFLAAQVSSLGIVRTTTTVMMRNG